MICVVMRRMKALSSTTSTRGLVALGAPLDDLEDTRSLAQRPHFDAPGQHVQEDAAAVVPAGVSPDDRHVGGGEHVAHGDDVPLSDVEAAGRHQAAEHARTADDL